MKSKWFKLLIVFSVGLAGSWMIGHFTKDPWCDRLEMCLTVGGAWWMHQQGWMNVSSERIKYCRLMGVLMLAALTILFVALTYSALHGSFSK